MASETSVSSSIESSRSAAESASGRAQGYANIALNIPRISVNGGGVLGSSSSGFSVDLDLYLPEKPQTTVPLFTPDIDLGELMDLASDANITFFTDKLS